MSSMMNGNAKMMPSHNFCVYIGEELISFSKVSSIEISVESEALMEGGENRYVHSLTKPVSAEKTLMFEHGVSSGSANGASDTPLRVGSSYKFIIVSVLDQDGQAQKTYMATDAILKKRRFSDLNAMSGEIFIESLEFVYKDLTEVP